MTLKVKLSELNVTIDVRQEDVKKYYQFDPDTDPRRTRFSVVRKVWDKQTGRNYAAKFMRKRRKGRSIRDEILREIGILQVASEQPRIVNLVEVFETSTEIAVVMEFASGGELFDLLETELDEAEVISLMRQILEGLSFLHKRNIVHCDIKPQNILLTKEFPNGTVKICDFGLSRLVTDGEEIRDIAGTTDYVAPEILSYEPITTATDMWAIGVLAYVMLSQNHSPFGADDKQETYLNISQVNLDFPEELFDNVSLSAIDFIKKLLQPEPSERLSVEECLDHSWIKEKQPPSPPSPAAAVSKSASSSISSSLSSTSFSSQTRQRHLYTPKTSDSDFFSDVGEEEGEGSSDSDSEHYSPPPKFLAMLPSPVVTSTPASSTAAPSNEILDSHHPNFLSSSNDFPCTNCRLDFNISTKDDTIDSSRALNKPTTASGTSATAVSEHNALQVDNQSLSQSVSPRHVRRPLVRSDHNHHTHIHKDVHLTHPPPPPLPSASTTSAGAGLMAPQMSPIISTTIPKLKIASTNSSATSIHPRSFIKEKTTSRLNDKENRVLLIKKANVENNSVEQEILANIEDDSMESCRRSASVEQIVNISSIASIAVSIETSGSGGDDDNEMSVSYELQPSLLRGSGSVEALTETIHNVLDAQTTSTNNNGHVCETERVNVCNDTNKASLFEVSTLDFVAASLDSTESRRFKSEISFSLSPVSGLPLLSPTICSTVSSQDMDFSRSTSSMVSSVADGHHISRCLCTIL